MIFLLASFLLFWNPADVDYFMVYADGLPVATTFDTVATVPATEGVTSFHVTSVRGALESAPSLTLTGEYADLSRGAEFTFTGVVQRGERSISLVDLPAPEAAWVFAGGVFVCRADYNGDGAVTLPDLATFGIYWRAFLYQADLNADGLTDLSDFAHMGNLYQWRE